MENTHANNQCWVHYYEKVFWKQEVLKFSSSFFLLKGKTVILTGGGGATTSEKSKIQKNNYFQYNFLLYKCLGFSF